MLIALPSPFLNNYILERRGTIVLIYTFIDSDYCDETMTKIRNVSCVREMSLGRHLCHKIILISFLYYSTVLYVTYRNKNDSAMLPMK